MTIAPTRLKLDKTDPINQGLLGLWGFLNAGLIVPDASSYRRNGRIINPYQYALGLEGHAYQGDQVSTYVSVGTNLGLTACKNIIVAARCYIPSSGIKGAVFKIGNNTDITGGDGFAFGVGGPFLESFGNNVVLLFEGVRWIDTSVAFGTGWHSLLLSLDSSGFPAIFLDGNLIYSDTTGAALNIGSLGPSIAQIFGYSAHGGNNRFFGGKISMVRIMSQPRGNAQAIARRLHADPWAGKARKKAAILSNPVITNTWFPRVTWLG